MLGILDMSHLAGLEANGQITPWARFTGHLVEVVTFVSTFFSIILMEMSSCGVFRQWVKVFSRHTEDLGSVPTYVK